MKVRIYGESDNGFEKEISDQKESEKKEQELYSKIGELQVQPGGRSHGLFFKSLGEMSVHQKKSLIVLGLTGNSPSANNVLYCSFPVAATTLNHQEVMLLISLL